jgi:hypothetical protein
LDDLDRYPWSVTVSAFEGDRTFKVGVQNGRVVCQPPPFGECSMDPDTADRLSAMYVAAADRARRQRPASHR